MKLNYDICGYDYKSLVYFENIIKKLKIPKEGKIVQLGTNYCVSFDRMCMYFGYKRCIGYDLVNPLNHPNVIIKDCAELDLNNKNDNYKISYCDIDVSNLNTSPELRMSAINWASKLIVKGGYILTNNTWAFKKHSKFDVESFLIKRNFKIIQLDEYKKYKWAKLFNQRTSWNTKSAMLCKKL